jgi:dephospho-CoA kinase
MMDNEKRPIPKVIGITGMPGSGKGEVCTIAKTMGLPVRSLGDVVRDRFSVEFPGRPMEEIGSFANEERKRFGNDIWAKRLVERIENLIEGSYSIIMVDGVRSPFEVEIFRERWKENFSIICVHSSPISRFDRLSVRGRGDDPLTFEDFEERDRRELGWGLGDVIARADIMVINEGTIDALKIEIDRLLKELIT